MHDKCGRKNVSPVYAALTLLTCGHTNFLIKIYLQVIPPRHLKKTNQ